MDLFRFRSSTSDPTVLERGEMILNYNSILWVERYSQAGEFEIVAQVSSGLLDLLPAGTLIGYVDSMEAMIVENIEIEETIDTDPKVTFTGRSFISYLENRIVGVNQARTSSTLVEYILPTNYSWIQAAKLISDHIVNTQNANDALVNVTVVNNVTGTGVAPDDRTINRGTVYDALLDLLAIDDSGVKTIRRNTFTGMGGSSANTVISIYKGVDRSNKVRFSWKSGDLSALRLFTSAKKLKNSALVLGRYVYTVVDAGPTKYDRRFMMVDASDLDGNLTAAPTGTALTTILAKMVVRGKQKLARQVNLNIGQTDISGTVRTRYRVDYNVGDLVTLDGNYGQSAVMRVTEYAEVEDENGESGHPTLSIPGAIP